VSNVEYYSDEEVKNIRRFIESLEYGLDIYAAIESADIGDMKVKDAVDLTRQILIRDKKTRSDKYRDN
jgi:hypothetical protein